MSEKPINNGRSATDVGLVGRDSIPQDAEPDQSWRMNAHRAQEKLLHTDTGGVVTDRDNKSNQDFREKRRQIMEILGDDKPASTDMRGPQPRRRSPQQSQSRNSGMMSLSDLAEGLDLNSLPVMDGLDQFAEMTAGQIYSDGMMNEANEASMLMDEFAAPARPTGGSWEVIKAKATLKSGVSIPVWMVEDQSTGMEIKKPFRIQEVAQRVASILNNSGNVNDPRLKKVLESYDKHVSLMKQIRVCRKAINEGQTNQKGRLTALQSELEQVNYFLGI